MHNRFSPFLFLVAAVLLSVGCTHSDDVEPSETSPKKPFSWASDKKSTAAPVESVLPENPGQLPEKSDAVVEELPQEPLPAKLDGYVTPEDPPVELPSKAEPKNPSEQEPVPIAPAFPPNPLREGMSPMGSNPMRRPSSPGSLMQDEPTREPSLPSGPADPSGPSSPPADSVPPADEPSSEPPPDVPEADVVPITHPPDVPPANAKRSRRAEREKEDQVPFDPIKENGRIFVDWTKPKLAVVITGREDGYIEPCGCAGLDKMKGGLSRRHTMIESLRERGWPLVAVDVGGFTKGYGPQTEIKFQNTIEAMRKMRYDAIGFGINDLRLPTGELVSVAFAPSPFVSANVGLLGFSANVTARSKIVEVGDLKIGVTAVLGKTYQGELDNQEIELLPPEEALAPIVPELKKKCNLLILLAYATKEESIALGQRFPDFGLVVTAGGPAEPPNTQTRIPDTRSLLIEVGEKGMNAVVLGFYDNPKEPIRYQRVPLDSRFAASKDMYRIMAAYQEQLKRQGLEGLKIHAVSHPQSELCGEFVGSEKCKSCHEESYRIWKKSGHAKAWKTLVELDPPRNFDPECISCHVIGWHPTEHFSYRSGFLSEKKTPEMVNVGCESCHGPGGAHCRAEDGSDLDLQEKLAKALVVTKEESRTNPTKMCQNCHDLDNSPDFDFDTYWPDVEHYETEDD
ncbi:MAG: hypothetical protein JW888_12380 [Pirellulales bacterium]|nr:hypothetical protein [Pirellulales bacterium]